MMTCEIGDMFGCYIVLSKPYTNGEHSFVHVKCNNCGAEYDLALSEIKNRPKQSCKRCRGITHKIYPDPKVGEIYANWKVIDGVEKRKGFWYFNCECQICHHTQYIRKDQLIIGRRSCDGCNYKAKTLKSEHKILKENIRRNQPFLTVFNHICNEAAKRSILVTITPQYLKEIYEKQNHRCAITGDYLPDIRKASVDRIDSSKPYEEGNIQITTKQANLSKHIMTMQELYEFCRKVVNHANQHPSTSLTTCEGSETND